MVKRVEGNTLQLSAPVLENAQPRRE
jgi:hypothetical protein